MIEILDSGQVDKRLVYVTSGEEAVHRLNKIKAPNAVYMYQGVKVGYHWVLHRITVDKLKLGSE